MNSDTDWALVPEEAFNEVITSFSDHRGDREKPLWTVERIDEAIATIEQYKSSKLHRTNKQYYYGKRYDVLEISNRKCLILKRSSDSDPVVRVVPKEDYYRVLQEVHQATGHGGRDKMLYYLKSTYLIPTSVVVQFLKLCPVCQSRRKFPTKGISPRPIVSNDFNHRGQVDIIDLQSTPDGHYKWLLSYQDHSTKFVFLRPLTTNGPPEVAMELLKIFLEVGCPGILQSDNGREFTAAVIQELTRLWPGCKIVSGRFIEGSSQDVEAVLRDWLIEDDTNNWALGCYFVQFRMNCTFHPAIRRSPYEALFGTEPKTGLQTGGVATQLLEKIVTEEELDVLMDQQDTSTPQNP